jgi:hypothetical protein
MGEYRNQEVPIGEALMSLLRSPPIDGPSRSIAAGLRGENPFRAFGDMTGASPTVGEDLQGRGVNPWLALGAEIAVPSMLSFAGDATDMAKFASWFGQNIEGIGSLALVAPRVWNRIKDGLDEVTAILQAAKASGQTIEDIRPVLQRKTRSLYDDILEQQEGLRVGHGDRWYMDDEPARQHDLLAQAKSRLDRITGADSVPQLTSTRNIVADDFVDRLVQLNPNELALDLDENALRTFERFKEAALASADETILRLREGGPPSRAFVQNAVRSIEEELGPQNTRAILRAMGLDDPDLTRRIAGEVPISTRDVSIDTATGRFGETVMPTGIQEILMDPLTAEPMGRFMELLAANNVSEHAFLDILRQAGPEGAMKQIEPWITRNKIDAAGLLQAFTWLNQVYLR